MSRLLRSAAAVALSALFALATSTGPALATDPPPTTTQPTTTQPTSTEPTTAEPTAAPTTTGTPPEDPATAQGTPDLQLAVSFDKPTYLGHETITVTARVTNAGTAAVARATVSSTGNVSPHFWTPLDNAVEPGHSVDFTARVKVNPHENLRMTVTVAASGGEGEANPDDNTVTATVPVTFVRGTYRGTAHGDRDNDGTADPGEALPGVEISISGGIPFADYKTVTDANGRFLFTDLPGGAYSTWVNAGEWYVPGPPVEVDGTDDPDVVLLGIPKIRPEELTATAAFTAPTYRVDDLARLDVTLTNKGSTTLAGIKAECWSTGGGLIDPGELGTGVTLAPGTAKTLSLSHRISALAHAEGHSRLTCHLGAPPRANGDVPFAAVARVTGGLAPKVVGYLGRATPRPQAQGGPPVNEPLPDVKVYLRDQVTGAVVTRAVTDANGLFTFLDVPAGLYDFGVVGPWRVVWTPYPAPPGQFIVRDGENGPTGRTYVVMPGPDQPDPDPTDHPTPTPTPPTDGNPAPPHAQPELADTGVAIAWLATGGLLVLAAGGTLLHLARRRARH
ncbi:hypothetical protein SUDANB95_03446 [Actinosynnema sp. ALI-1.44]